MKHFRRLIVINVIVLLALLAFAGCGGSETTSTTTKAAETTTTVAEATTTAAPVDDTVYELSIAHFWPAGHAIESRFIQPWAQEISDATDGKVKIISYPGGTLLKGPETYEGVVKGVADMGMAVYAYNAGRFPVVEAFLLPGISWSTAKSSGAAITEGLQQLDAAEIKDVRTLSIFSTGNGAVLSKTPIRSLADLKGLELGATAGPRGDGLKALGATPVVLPMPEVYDAQSRGVIKGVVTPTEVLTGFKLVDVTDYITDTPFLYVQFCSLVMNNAKFDELPAAYQEAITTITQKYYSDVLLGLWDQLNKEALDAALATKKIETITLSDAEQAMWKEKLAPVLTDYQKVLDGKGLDGAKIIETVKQLSDKYNAMYPAQ